jgi:hypothetical protein
VRRPGRRDVLRQASAALAAAVVLSRHRARASQLTVHEDEAGAFAIREGGQPILTYRYATVPRPAPLTPPLTEREAESWRLYGHPRSNYIHPLHGLDGVPLTADWSRDHPHHRGIYWAWPEVGYRGELGDLHALQRVFARPTGKVRARTDDGRAELSAENEWRWDDATPIVREHATIAVHPRGPQGRLVDLRFTFEALLEGVTLARRQQKLYGGLNVRLAPVAGLALAHHADPAGASPRMAWESASGTWQGARGPSTLTIFERTDNPHYPGDYVQYPELPWFQPTFPSAGTRYVLAPRAPLTLWYRLWLHEGPPPSDAECRTQWRALQDAR